MYIVNENDERKIDKATYLAGERARKLQDTVKNILAFREDKKLTSEIIEQASEILEGKKRWTDIVSERRDLFCLVIEKSPLAKNVFNDWISVGIVPLDKGTIAFGPYRTHFCPAKKGKDYIVKGWNQTPGMCESGRWPSTEKMLERVTPIVGYR